MTTRVRVRTDHVTWSPSWRRGHTSRPAAGMLLTTAWVLVLPAWLVLRALGALATVGLRALSRRVG